MQEFINIQNKNLNKKLTNNPFNSSTLTPVPIFKNNSVRFANYTVIIEKMKDFLIDEWN